MKKIEVLIIGASRSGTTTLYEYLDRHPQICFSEVKELHYFSFDDLYARGEKYYHEFIKHQTGNQVIVSSSTYLMIDRKAPERIARYNPDMKIIAILREPVARAFSGYRYAVNNGYESEKNSFVEHMKNESKYIEINDIIQINNLCNLHQSKYFEHLQFWENYFPRHNFLILKSDDIFRNKELIFKRLSDSLKIDANKFTTEKIHVNSASGAKFKALQQVFVNRNHPITKVLRHIIPAKLRYKIIRSGVTEKISNLNRKQTDNEKITNEEFAYAQTLLEQDLILLQQNYNIHFDSEL